jgi:glycosyltransferase involved in cell wall biosynthesis
MSTPERLRVLWISHGGIGVSETFIAETVRSLQSMSELTAISGGSKASPEDARLGVQPMGFMSLRPSLARWLKKAALGGEPWIAAAQRRAARACRSLVQEMRPDVAWVDYATSAVFAKALLRDAGIPYVVAVHGYDLTSSMRSAVYRQEFAEAVSEGAAAVACASHHMARMAVLAGVPAAKSCVMRYPIDTSRIARDERIAKTEHPSFIHLGRLVEQKGPLVTLEAFALVAKSIPGATLTYIGEGDLRPELERRIRERSLQSRVRLLGAMHNAQALAEMQSQWIYCQHSVTGRDGSQEGFAISPAEAACMEVPVVSTWHNGIPEHVLDGVTGYLVREEMARRMIELANDPALRQRLGQAGRANIRELCDPVRRQREMRDLLRRVTGRDR